MQLLVEVFESTITHSRQWFLQNHIICLYITSYGAQGPSQFEVLMDTCKDNPFKITPSVQVGTPRSSVRWGAPRLRSRARSKGKSANPQIKVHRQSQLRSRNGVPLMSYVVPGCSLQGTLTSNTCNRGCRMCINDPSICLILLYGTSSGLSLSGAPLKCMYSSRRLARFASTLQACCHVFASKGATRLGFSIMMSGSDSIPPRGGITSDLGGIYRNLGNEYSKRTTRRRFSLDGSMVCERLSIVSGLLNSNLFPLYRRSIVSEYLPNRLEISCR